jgi:RNA polymerase sigma-70 factor (ECF subfamily)
VIDLSDPKCFKAEYERHFSGLRYYAVKCTGREDVASDLLQDFFMRLWERGERFGSEYALGVYMYRSVRNRCLTWLRDNRRHHDRLAAMERPETEESFLNGIIESEIYALINDVFAELPASSKRVYLKSLEGKSHKEIAEELKIAVNTIKRHKNNANKYLRKRLGDIFSLLSLIG